MALDDIYDVDDFALAVVVKPEIFKAAFLRLIYAFIVSK